MSSSALIRISAAVLSAAAALAFGAYHFLFRMFERFDTAAHPAGEGACGDGWEIKSCGGVPYLIADNMPYPSDFDSSNRPRQSLNGFWMMRLDPEDNGERLGWHKLTEPGEGWEKIEIPSTINAASGENPNYLGPAWFFLRFTPEISADENHLLRICFEGVLIRSKAWFNGILISEREGGWTPQYADVSEAVIPGVDNILIVRADNRLTETSLPTRQWDYNMPGWHPYAGIFRDVYIDLLPRDYIFKADYSCRLENGRAFVDFNVLARCESENAEIEFTLSGHGENLKLSLKAAASKDNVSLYSFTVSLDEPRLWSPEQPDLYDASVKLGNDEVSFRAGIRTAAFDKTGFLLNSKKVFLKGISRHEDHPKHGASQTAELIDSDLKLIKDMGANYMRMAHYPHDARELRKARDIGLMLAEEIPLYQSGTGFVAWYAEKRPLRLFPWRTFGNRQLSNRTLLLNAQRQLAEMIERDRLNPAIIMWGVANETYTLDGESGKIHGWLADTARALDSARPVTMAELTYGMPVLDNRRMAGKRMDAVSINIYSGWYYGMMEDVKQLIGKVHDRFPDKPVIISECGAEAAPGRRDSDGVWIAEKVPPGKTYSEDYQERLLEHYVRHAIKTPYIAGVSPWVFADFFCPEFPSNPVPYYNSKGVVSKDRVPKKSYFMLKRLYHEDV